MEKGGGGSLCRFFGGWGQGVESGVWRACSRNWEEVCVIVKVIMGRKVGDRLIMPGIDSDFERRATLVQTRATSLGSLSLC